MKKTATLLQIAQLGDPVLRKVAKPVKNVKYPVFQQLIDDLIATVDDADGVGIAAPQVYKSHRIFILASYPNIRYPNAPKMKPTAIINPRIISLSDEMGKNWEGCLSIPGIRGLVPRHKEIEVEYTDRTGVLRKKKFTDFVARIFQHEYDHLEGIVFLDRMDSTKDIISEKEFQKLMDREDDSDEY